MSQQHRLMALCLGLPGWGGTRKVVNLDLLEQDIVSGNGISWAICKSAPHPRHITMPACHHLIYVIGWNRVSFACLSMQSLIIKLEDMLEIVRDCRIDIFYVSRVVAWCRQRLPRLSMWTRSVDDIETSCLWSAGFNDCRAAKRLTRLEWAYSVTSHRSLLWQHPPALILLTLTTTSDTNIATADRCLLHHSDPVCSWPTHLHWLQSVLADAHSTYHVSMLCCISSAMPDPLLCTVSHTSESNGCTGVLSAGLWKWCPGRPSGPPDASTSVGPKCSGLTDLLAEDPWPYFTDAVISLHWLWVPERIQYKLVVLAFKVLHSNAPLYINPLIRIEDLPGRRPLHSTNTNRLVVPPVNSR